MQYPAEFYVALHTGTPGDVSFYQRVCRDARSVLELGCGDGRILSRLRRPGRVLVGLERDAGMLALARARGSSATRQARARSGRVTWLRGDMARFALGRRFDAILIPFSGFFCLSPRHKRACLDCVVQHLRPGGKLVLDAYGGHALRDASARREPVVDPFTWVANVSCNGERYEVFERDTWWPSRQRLDIRYSYRRPGARPCSGELRHWYLFVEQVEALLDAAGFVSERRRLSSRVPLEQQWALVATPR